MKISIKSKSYINNPAPMITTEMFDIIWGEWWKHRIYHVVDCIETIDIEINQAFSSSPVHFYITVNGVYEFHRKLEEWDYSEFENTKRIFGSESKFYTRNKNFIDGCFGFDSEFDLDSIIWELEGEGTENAILKNT
jgi:hypothetical protein